MISRLWPKTKRAWLYLALFAAAFLLLDALALAGVELAVGLLATLGGAVAGILVAAVTVYPLARRIPRDGVWRTLLFFAGIFSTFGIILGGSALAGIPLFPTAEAGDFGAFIYGLALGFGGSVGTFARGGGAWSAFTGALHTDEESRSIHLRFALAVLGAVAGLLFLCLLGYLAIEYVVAPLVRSFV